MRIGIIGGGQLARMMLPASINIGLDVRVFSEARECSAQLGVSAVGDYRDFTQLSRFASEVDVITFDHEHVPLEHLSKIQKDGTKVFPSPDSLLCAQDKIAMRRKMSELGLPQPRWAIARDVDDVDSVSEVGGFPCIAKQPVGGYDGRGVRVINALEECKDWLAEGVVLLEELVEFVRELSQLSARRPSGDWKAWPVVETRQESGVCAEVIAGSLDLSDEVHNTAQELAERIARGLGVVGVLAVELFETDNSELLVNELAMRPHNSGHVFTELSKTSQFEQHLRAVADLPLGSTELLASVGVMVNVFGEVSLEGQSSAWESYPETKIHSYRKAPRAGRKAGHVVSVGSNLELVLAQTRGARDKVLSSS